MRPEECLTATQGARHFLMNLQLQEATHCHHIGDGFSLHIHRTPRRIGEIVQAEHPLPQRALYLSGSLGEQIFRAILLCIEDDISLIVSVTAQPCVKPEFTGHYRHNPAERLMEAAFKTQHEETPQLISGAFMKGRKGSETQVCPVFHQFIQKPIPELDALAAAAYALFRMRDIVGSPPLCRAGGPASRELPRIAIWHPAGYTPGFRQGSSIPLVPAGLLSILMDKSGI